MKGFILLVLITLVCGCGVFFRKEAIKSPPKVEKEEISYTKEKLRELFNKGVEYYKEKEFDSAIEVFSQVLRISPDYPEAQDYFEQALRKRMVVERPEEEKAEVETEKPKEKVAEGREKKEDPSKPKKEAVMIEEEIKRMPFDEKGIEEWLEVEKEVEKKVEEEEKEELVASEEERKGFEFAQGLFKKGLFREAISEFQDFLGRYPGSVLRERAIFEIGEAHLKLEEYAEAQESFRQILALEGGKLKDEAQFKICQCLEKRGDLDTALLEYLRFESLYPKSGLKPKVQLEIANIHRKKRDYTRALIEYNKIMAHFPDTDDAGEACFNIGDIYDRIYEVRDFRKAVDAYKKLITNYPESRWYPQARERKRYIEDNYL